MQIQYIHTETVVRKYSLKNQDVKNEMKQDIKKTTEKFQKTNKADCDLCTCRQDTSERIRVVGQRGRRQVTSDVVYNRKWFLGCYNNQKESLVSIITLLV